MQLFFKYIISVILIIQNVYAYEEFEFEILVWELNIHSYDYGRIDF